MDRHDTAGAVGALAVLGFVLPNGSGTLVFGRQMFASTERFRDAVEGYASFSFDDRGLFGVFGRIGWCRYEIEDSAIGNVSDSAVLGMVGLDLSGLIRLFLGRAPT